MADGGTQKVATASQENKDLQNLLKSDSGSAAFETYLSKQYTEHHLHFWLEVEKFREMEDPVKKKQSAIHMFDHYVKVGTKNQVNLYTPIRNAVTEKINEMKEKGDEGTIASDAFDAAQKVVWDMFKGNYYRSFLQSDDYKVWQAQKAQEEEAKKAEQQDEKKKSSVCVIL